MIFICPTYYDDSIVTGSTKYSIAKFWAGVGALQPNADTFKDLILTPKQLAVAKFEWQEVKIGGLVGKNFKKIRVLEYVDLCFGAMTSRISFMLKSGKGDIW